MTDLSRISFDLIRKYNVQGPRYTSYPPAPSWSNDVGPEEYENTVLESNKAGKPRPLSLYLHIPFCEHLCYFCGCTTIITGDNHNLEKGYLDCLLKELAGVSSLVNVKRSVVQLHLGGGTPTYLKPDHLTALLGDIRKRFTFSPDAEIGVEIDPRVTTTEQLRIMRDYGVNRLSMGVQDFDIQVQQAVHRIQPYEQTEKLFKEARALGFGSINLDLIYGLPLQTPKGFEETAGRIVGLGPDRLAVYSYAYVPWMKRHQSVMSDKMPSERDKYEIFLTAVRMFTGAGYEYIGMDHFAKPGDELSRAREERTLWRNFQGYTTKAGTDLFGLGLSAISHIHGGFFQNERDLRAYQDAIKNGRPATMRGFRLSQDDKIRARVIQNLLCHTVVIKSEIEDEFGIDFDRYFDASLKDLKEPEKDGLVQVSKSEIRPTLLGRVFLRNLAMAFDAYLPKAGEKTVFSRTL
ncbi:MAG: oxygen-independent coproporphyrinogen III oxidase [Elusimicrobia bacterium]|nr:oxygen-independent coproporphyrinogen III oxidase [Candidatus Obscuribacterium magneticum]